MFSIYKFTYMYVQSNSEKRGHESEGDGKGYMGAIFGGRKGKVKIQLYYYPKNTIKKLEKKNTAIIFKESIKK